MQFINGQLTIRFVGERKAKTVHSELGAIGSGDVREEVFSPPKNGKDRL